MDLVKKAGWRSLGGSPAAGIIFRMEGEPMRVIRSPSIQGIYVILAAYSALILTADIPNWIVIFQLTDIYSIKESPWGRRK